MKKISTDELFFMAGEKLEIDNMEGPCEYHNFSEHYEQRKSEMLKRVREDSKKCEVPSEHSVRPVRRRISFRRWSTAAAAAVFALGLSLSAYAYFGHIAPRISQDGNQVSVQMKESLGQTTEDGNTSAELSDLPEEGVEISSVKISVDYVPEGFERIDGESQRCTYTHDGSFGGKGFWVLQETSREIINNYVESYEQSMIGDMEALVLTPQMTDSTSTYRQVIYLFNPQDMVMLMVGSDDPQLSAEELKKVAESVSYEPTGEKIMAYSTSTLPVQKEMTLADRSFDKDQVKDSFLVESYDGQKVQVNVKDISFLDTISGLNKNNFYDSENLENYVETDGTLKDERVVQSYGDNGYPISAVRESVDQKLMLVTLELANDSDQAVEELFLNSFDVLALTDDGEQLVLWENSEDYLDTLEVDGAVYLDGAQNTEGEERVHSFFAVSVPANSTKTVTLGFCIFADEVENSYLSYNSTGGGFSETNNPMFQLYRLDTWKNKEN